MNSAAAERRVTLIWRCAALALVAVLIGSVYAVCVGALPSAAHATVLSTAPADGAVLDAVPESAELRFDEPVRLVEEAIRLFSEDGDTSLVLEASTVDTTVIVPLPADLDDGAYALTYRIVSADGHPVGGAISFQIGEGAPSNSSPKLIASANADVSTEVAVSILTVLHYLGILVFAGLLYFDRVVLRVAQKPLIPRNRRLVFVAYGVGVLSSFLLIPLSALRIVGGQLAAIFASEVWLPGVMVQPVMTALLIAAAGAAALVFGFRSSRRPSRVAAILCAAAAISAPILVGHTQTVPPGWLMIAADLGHLIAAAFWVGGVVGLLSFLATVRAGSAAGLRTSPVTAAEVTVRFSRFAFVSVVVLAVSGTIMGVLVLDTPDALFDTAYGRTLLLKLGVVVLVVVLAAWNRVRLLPLIAERSTPAQQWRSLRRILAYEAALLVAVVVVTGFLVNSSPRNSVADNPTAPGVRTAVPYDAPVHIESQNLIVHGALSPAATGQNILTFTLSYDGVPVTPESVSVETRLPEQEIGPIPAIPQLDVNTGEYQADLTMPVAGTWQIQITARIDTYTQPIATMSIAIR